MTMTPEEGEGVSKGEATIERTVPRHVVHVSLYVIPPTDGTEKGPTHTDPLNQFEGARPPEPAKIGVKAVVEFPDIMQDAYVRWRDPVNNEWHEEKIADQAYPATTFWGMLVGHRTLEAMGVTVKKPGGSVTRSEPLIEGSVANPI